MVRPARAALRGGHRESRRASSAGMDWPLSSLPRLPGAAAAWFVSRQPVPAPASNSQTRKSEGRGRLGPELALECGLGFVDRSGVGAGGEVLPAAVRLDQHDLGLRTVACGAFGLSNRGMQDRARRYPGEDAFLLDELSRTANRVTAANRERGVDEGLVVQLGDEALVDVAQAVDDLAVAGLRGDDLHVRLAFAEKAPEPHQRARRTKTCDDMR